MLFGTREQGVPVVLRELVLPGLISPSFIVGDVTIGLSGPRARNLVPGDLYEFYSSGFRAEPYVCTSEEFPTTLK
ncbi:unnamed protein product [Schistosoma mattheei]|uniref:Uncharacterized protein n=1 Tax=Schistosoma mattheei TaxID=31246 RepID=A0A183PB01_9TREM|nr:unnamed protein product [Schistosoma mattheei]